MSSPREDAWSAAMRIVSKLRAHGHRALLAGGCVRDRLLGLPPKDYDVATDAVPDQITALFPQSRHVGVKFGVILVRLYGQDLEVATFRSDGPYTDGRRPDHIVFGNEAEDARRRDFTINGLFHDPVDDKVIDYVGGRRDLEAGVIRTIGNPDARFGEDHLRLLRAVRFAARFGFVIEPETQAAMERHAAHLAVISAERIWMELEGMLAAPTRAAAWEMIQTTGLRGYLAPSWDVRKDEESLDSKRLAALPTATLAPEVGLAALLSGRTREGVVRITRELRLSNQQSDAVGWLVRSLPAALDESRLELADLKRLMAHPHWSDLLLLLRADVEARGADPEPCARLSERASQIPPEQVSPPPLLTGDDLQSMGLKPGRRLGEIWEAVYRAQLNDAVTTRAQAEALVKGMMA